MKFSRGQKKPLIRGENSADPLIVVLAVVKRSQNVCILWQVCWVGGLDSGSCGDGFGS